MIHSDNETAVDLLNKSAMVSTIAKAIRFMPDKPKTIGVYGDWGAGKSSILEMVEKRFSDSDRTLCIKFNCWRFQGFADAKISIIEGIVKELINRQSLFERAETAVKDILKRVDLLKAARLSSNLLFNLTTGIPTYDQLKIMFQSSNHEEIIKTMDIFKDESESDASKKLPEEVSEFLTVFQTLLEKAEIDQLVVLVDDLDRCLPKFVVETLEAMRLFLFAKRTAFVIAVDETLVELSVREHFPQQADSQLSDDYAKKYIEKIIQLPFHISPMSEIGTQNYITLLMIGGRLGENSDVFKDLIKMNKNIPEKLWKESILENEKIRKVLGNKIKIFNKMISVIEKIKPIIAKGLKGNPRQIKRFLNTLILRENAAHERGYVDSLDYQVLTKLLLAELFQTPLFDRIAYSVSESSDGKCKELAILENAVDNEENLPLDTEVLTKFTEIRKPMDPELEIWTSGEALNWLKLEPNLADKDLNPYLYISNVKRPYKDNPRIEFPVDENAETRLS